MEHVLQLLQAGWHALQLVAPWLVVSLIPSLIVGLTPFPKAADAVTLLRTIFAAAVEGPIVLGRTRFLGGWPVRAVRAW
jgi:hypothetical protein